MRQCHFFIRATIGMWAGLLPCCSLLAWPCQAAEALAETPAASPAAAPPGRTSAIQYSEQTRSEPRPLRLHVLRIDLQAPEWEVAVAVGDDPDGDGPAEAQLTGPRTLAARAGLAAAVNTNPWAMVPAVIDGVRTPYVAGGPCDISGWAVSQGVLRSPPQAGHWNFWVDDQRRARLGPQPGVGSDSIRQGVAGFGGLLRGGEILPAPSTVLHPRTALGLDAEGRWLTLAVVDGRQKGYSEGLSERELAQFMAEWGCSDALNLDGGGSSILLLADAAGTLQVKNRPSDALGPRPVPVLLGVRPSPRTEPPSP